MLPTHPHDDRLTLMLRALVPRPVADGLELLNDPADIAEMLGKYLAADEDGKADIVAFHESDGPGMVQDAHERLGPEGPGLERGGLERN